MQLQTAVAIWILLGGAALAQAPQSGVWIGIGPLAGAAAVQNKPFSADLIVTNDRKQVAGNDQKPAITDFGKELHGKVARNSQGLTFLDMQIPSPVVALNKGSHITITNPAEHTFISLNPQNKTAIVNHNTYPAGAPFASGSNASGNAAAAGPSVIAGGRFPDAGSSTSHAQNKTSTEQLGTKVIEGLPVTGVRTTSTTSWAVNGEAKTMTSVTETWTSPELKAIILREATDSNGGRHVSRLTNIVRTEPDAALFRIPADYTVKNITAQPSALGVAR